MRHDLLHVHHAQVISVRARITQDRAHGSRHDEMLPVFCREVMSAINIMSTEVQMRGLIVLIAFNTGGMVTMIFVIYSLINMLELTSIVVNVI